MVIVGPEETTPAEDRCPENCNEGWLSKNVPCPLCEDGFKRLAELHEDWHKEQMRQLGLALRRAEA